MEAGIKLTPRRLQKNIERWSKWDPRHAVNLQYLDTDDYTFYETEQGELNLRKGDFFYHDPKGALEEAKEWFSGFDKTPFKLIYIYGTGLGYAYLAAKEWLDSNKEHQIVFLEDDLAVLHRLFETDVGTEMLRDKRIRITFFHSVHHNESPFRMLFWKFLNTPFTVQAFPSYQEKNKNIYEELTHKLIYDASINNGILDEYYKYGIVFYRNFYHSLLHLPGCYNGNEMYGKFPKIPAIICGAGPSIGKQFELLRSLDTRAILFAGGSALNALNAADIMPHFGAGIDPNPAQYDRYLSNTSYELPFFFRTRLHHRAFDLVHGPKLYLTGSGGYSITRYFEELFGIAGDDINEGFNVINFLISLAHRMGCDPIILVGMDLGYTNLQSYAPGVVDDAGISEEQLQSCETGDERPLLKKDIHGKTFYTLWKWIAESEWIEDYAKENREITLLNATEGGLGFGSVPNVTLKEAVDTYCNQQKGYHLWVHSQVQDCVLHLSKSRIVEAVRNLRESLTRCITRLDLLISETKLMKRTLKEKQEPPLTLQSGEAVLAEMELGNEDGFQAVLTDFNEMYNMILQGQMEETRHMRSEKRIGIKKMQIQEKKYRFLKEVARANIMSIDWALKKEKKK